LHKRLLSLIGILMLVSLILPAATMAKAFPDGCDETDGGVQRLGENRYHTREVWEGTPYAKFDGVAATHRWYGSSMLACQVVLAPQYQGATYVIPANLDGWTAAGDLFVFVQLGIAKPHKLASIEGGGPGQAVFIYTIDDNPPNDVGGAWGEYDRATWAEIPETGHEYRYKIYAFEAPSGLWYWRYSITDLTDGGEYFFHDQRSSYHSGTQIFPMFELHNENGQLGGADPSHIHSTIYDTMYRRTNGVWSYATFNSYDIVDSHPNAVCDVDGDDTFTCWTHDL
jgi:hypothetical protein